MLSIVLSTCLNSKLFYGLIGIFKKKSTLSGFFLISCIYPILNLSKKFRNSGSVYRYKGLKLLFVYTVSRSLVFWVKEYFSIFLKKNKFRVDRESVLGFFFFRVNNNLSIAATSSVIFREPVFLIQILTYVFNHVHFFNHIMMLKRTFFFILSLCFKKNVLSGFLVSVSGKISVGGNARSRVFKIK